MTSPAAAASRKWKTAALSSAHLLDALSESTRSSLLSQAQRAEIPANVQLCREGEIANQLFLINRGMASYARLTNDGKQTVLFWLQPGDSFGLGTFISKPHPYLGTATSMSPCQIFSWDHNSVRRLALAHPQLASNAIAVVLSYGSYLAERHSDVLASTAEGRVAKALLRLAGRKGAAGADGVDIQITNEQLASLADVSLFTVSRLVSAWSRKGTVKKGRKTLRVLAPEELLPYAR